MSLFSLNVEFSQDVAIFKTSGYINDLGGEKIETRCVDALRQGYRKFIINFDASPIINSIGVSILIGVIDSINKAEGSVSFSNVTGVNSEVFEFMGLTKFARIFSTQAEAVHHVTGVRRSA